MNDININWQILENGKGSYANTPEAIDSLWSSDLFERKNNGYHWLGSIIFTPAVFSKTTIVSAPGLYEAAYYIIDPIVQGLEKTYTINRLYPLKLLTEIALKTENNKIFTSQETGETLNLIESCRNKLISLKSKIALIEVRDYDEIREKKFMLELISFFEGNVYKNKSKIDWKSIKCLVGSSEFIPLAIYKLWSKDEEERKNLGYYQLDNVVVVQSGLFEAAYYVIDPILEGLENSYTVNRLYPLRVLIEIAGGSAEQMITLQDTGETINITEACRRKISSLKTRIAAIEVREEDEIDEKEFLMEEIETFS